MLFFRHTKQTSKNVADISFKEYKTSQPENVISVNELKDALFSLKINKTPGEFQCCQKVFWSFIQTFATYFSPFYSNWNLPDELKIASVTPTFKGGESWNLENYRPISVLPCFSEILERIMPNRLYKYLADNNKLYKKQFGFQRGHSTEHAIILLVDQINNNFEKDQYTLGVFINLSKALTLFIIIFWLPK